MARVKEQASGSYTFESSYYDDNGARQVLTVATSLAIRDGSGASVSYSGIPTLKGGDIVATVPVAALAHLDTYTLTWTGSVGSTVVTWSETVELVGGYLFELSALRGMDRAFSDIDKYPTDTLKEVRSQVEDVIEGPRAANVAFVPRGRRVVLGSTQYGKLVGGTSRHPAVTAKSAQGLQVPDYELRSVYSAKVNGTALTTDEVTALVPDDNMIWRSSHSWPAGRQNIELHYTHGMSQVPGAITRAALILAREYLVKSDLPGRATATSIGDQMFRLTIAGRDGVTGIPDVDAAIDQFGRKGYGIG